MGTLSRQSEAPAGAAEEAVTAAPAEAAAPAASMATDTAPDTTASGGTEADQQDIGTLEGASGKEQHSSTWGPPGSEKQLAAATPDTEDPEGYSRTYTAAKKERLQQQRLGQQQQEDKSENQHGNEVAPSCIICFKDAPDSGIPEGLPWVCESCSNKQQQQEGNDDIQAEGISETVPSAPSAVPSTALEETEVLHSRAGLIEMAEDSTAKAPCASRSTTSSSSSGSGGAGSAASRFRGASAGTNAAAAAAAAGSRKCIDEGSVRRHVVPVGPRHQVPCLPPFFLENAGMACCCGSESGPVLDPSLTARLVYSPSSLERVRQRRLAEGLADRAICSEGDMEAFMQQCAKNWKANKPGWQPFSPEFAFKLLHYAGYDPAKALQLMEDPQFPFQLVCDGPVRRYDNKWRPKDRRGVISPTPYPPPVFLRGYLSRRHYRDSSGYSLR